MIRGMARRTVHVIGIDDAPFAPHQRGDVTVVGALCAGARLDGMLLTRVRRDGANSTRALAAMIGESRFLPQLHLVLLQGITLAGFNVVDIHALQRALCRPVLAVARRRPDMGRVRSALLGAVPGGARKWRLIERAGEPVRVAGLWVQAAGISPDAAEPLLRELCANGAQPEPLRIAHLMATGLAGGWSRQRS